MPSSTATHGKMTKTSLSTENEALPSDWVELGYIRVTKCLTPDGVNFWIYIDPEINDAERMGMIDMLEEYYNGYS